jgi:hypothetical protein
MSVMVWYLTPDQTLIHRHRDSKTNKNKKTVIRTTVEKIQTMTSPLVKYNV